MKITSNLMRQYGPYKAVEMLEGSTDMALFHAMHTQTGRAVLLRVLAVRNVPDATTISKVIDQCLHELQQLEQVTHPHLIPMLDHGADGKYLFVAYPELTGYRLAEMLYGTGQHYPIEDRPALRLPSLAATAQLLQQVGAALQTLHDANYTHGQVEPYSVFLSGSTALLTEAGIPWLQRRIFQLNMTSSFSMTRYNAPEVWTMEHVIPASDQYALACLAYELLTGSAPFESLKIIDLMQAHLHQMPQPPHQVRPELSLPEALAPVFQRALAKAASDRFPSVAAFVADLTLALNAP